MSPIYNFHFSGLKAWGVKFTTHFHLDQCLRMRGAIPLHGVVRKNLTLLNSAGSVPPLSHMTLQKN
jgi:hypothetical protein